MNHPREESRKRITARLSGRVGDTLEQAAELLGATVNQFVVEAAHVVAQRVIERESVIHLSRKDARKVLALLDHPPKPNKRLKGAGKGFKMKRVPNSKTVAREGFTLIELLVVVFVVWLLLGLALRGHSAERTKSKGLQCLGNLRQLSLAWRMYAEDNRDYFLYSSDDGAGTEPYEKMDTISGHQGNDYSWTWSKMDFNPNNAYNTDPAADIMLRPMWRYNKSTDIYKCPGDNSMTGTNGVWIPRIRSYSMNFYLGGFGGNAAALPSESWAQHFRPYTKLTDLADAVHSPGPANTFLFVEERDDFIYWGNFITSMAGYPIPGQAAAPGLYEWYDDMPGAYHERGGGISFCDGHAEIHKWLNGTTTPAPPPSAIPVGGGTSFPAPYSVDVAWMQNAAARPH